MIVKAITIWEPYASAIANGLKKYETRTWKTNYRGKVAIHASIKKLDTPRSDLAKSYKLSDLRFGQFVAIADLTDCVLMTKEFINSQTDQEKAFGNWNIGNYAWKLENIQIIDKKEIVHGKQGFWNTAIIFSY